MFRFYQGEWLTHVPKRTGWSAFFREGLTPVCNPGIALVTESKRFPLVWDELTTSLKTWRSLLPEARDPRSVRWRREKGWLLKTAFCNTGDTVAALGVVDQTRWRAARLDALLHPGHWVAQRVFDTLPISTSIGPVYPCLGVYTINGAAAGIYGRFARKPLIDYEATDLSVLVCPS